MKENKLLELKNMLDSEGIPLEATVKSVLLLIPYGTQNHQKVWCIYIHLQNWQIKGA